MKKFKFLIIIIVIIGGAILISSFFSSRNKADLRKENKKEIKKLNTILVKNEKQPYIITTSGRMIAFNKVEIFAEVSGVLENSSINFKDGNWFKKGEVMININPDVFYNNLLAQKSSLLNQLTLLLPDLRIDFPEDYMKWEKYLESFDINKPLNPLPENLSKKETFYISSRNIFKLYYDIKSMEATYNKYSIEAPFNGYVIQSNINPGTLVRNGQKLGEFISPALYEMEAPIKLSELNLIRIGQSVVLTNEDINKKINGKIVRINKSIDPQSQSVNIVIRSSDKKILDGMFFNVNIKSISTEKLAKLPSSAVRNDDTVLIKDKDDEKVVNVNVVKKTATYTIVEGLDDNTQVIVEGTAN